MKRTNILSLLLGALLVRFGITDDEAAAGNAAGGASSDEQSTEGSAPAATDGASAEKRDQRCPECDGWQRDCDEFGCGVIDLSNQANPSADTLGVDAGNDAAAAVDGAQAAGDAPVGGGEPLPLGAGGVIVAGADAGDTASGKALRRMRQARPKAPRHRLRAMPRPTPTPRAKPKAKRLRLTPARRINPRVPWGSRVR